MSDDPNLDLAAPAQHFLDKARAALEEKRHDQCLSLLTTYWLDNPDDISACKILIDLLKDLGKDEIKDLTENLSKLSNSPATWTQDQDSLFEAGFGLIDQRQFALARILLEHCLRMSPDDLTINYELGFVEMMLKEFGAAVKYFEKAEDTGRDFDTSLNLAVCYILTHQNEKAANRLALMEELAQSDEEKYALSWFRDVLKRLNQIPEHDKLSPVKDQRDQQRLGVRDSLYVLYGSVLLHDGEPGVQVEFLTDEESQTGLLAKSIVMLASLVKEQNLSFDAIEYYNLAAKPIATCLSNLLNLPTELFQGANRKGKALMVMNWSGEIIGPHEAFTANDGKRVIFAFGLTSFDTLPVTPDIVGIFTSCLTLPWLGDSEQLVDGSEAGVKQVTDSLQAAVTKAVDTAKPEQELLSNWLKDKAANLIFNNCDKFAKRPEYTAEAPF